MSLRIIYFFIIIAVILSCNSSYTYKKKGYFKIDFPEKKYQVFDEPGYPYRFEYPVYATVSKDTSFFGEATENPWWINIDVPKFHSRIYISYKEVGKNNFDSLVNDGYKMAYKQHTDIATSIVDSPIVTANNAEGFYFSLGGNTATANQFFLTDSTRHFLRGALYFDATPNEDSLGIVNEFLKEDLKHLINTLEWTDDKKGNDTRKPVLKPEEKANQLENKKG
jgi:gliding motility-associated lipoprotein GldD